MLLYKFKVVSMVGHKLEGSTKDQQCQFFFLPQDFKVIPPNQFVLYFEFVRIT
jgi:hypothetical protein